MLGKIKNADSVTRQEKYAKIEAEEVIVDEIFKRFCVGK